MSQPLVQAFATPTVSRARQEQVYREYMDFFEAAERQRRWHFQDDIPWSELDASHNLEDVGVCLETFCGVELYVPDYTASGFIVNRSIMGHAWFQACWGYEESKHALVFREYLVRSGLRTLDQYRDFEERILARVWELPYATRRQMICYGALQEAATYHIYLAQKHLHRARGNRVLEQIFFLVSRDEAAHAGFYRSMLKLEFESDAAGALADLAHVVFNFKMPGAGLIPEYEERVKTEGVGLPGNQLLAKAVLPLLRTFGVSRRELFAVMSAQRKGEAVVDPEFLGEAKRHEAQRRLALTATDAAP